MPHAVGTGAERTVVVVEGPTKFQKADRVGEPRAGTLRGFLAHMAEVGERWW